MLFWKKLHNLRFHALKIEDGHSLHFRELPAKWILNHLRNLLWLHWVFVTVNKLSLVAKGEVYSPAAMGSLFTVAASCFRARGPECRLRRRGTRAWLPRSMWDLPGPGIESVSPALTGGFLTTGPSGKSSLLSKTCAFSWFVSPTVFLAFFTHCFFKLLKKFLQGGCFSDLWHSPLIFVLISLQS